MIEAILAGMFGLLIGSFLNVCIHRWPRNVSVWRRARSYCPRCRKTIAWYDNIPLVSFAVLGGKCRNCRRAISWRYPVVEALTGICFFLALLWHGPGLGAAKLCVFSALMIGSIFSDFEKHILPDEFTIGGTILGLVFAWFHPMPLDLPGMMASLGGDLPNAQRSLIDSAVPAAFFAAMLWLLGWLYERVRGVEGMGLGDVKLIAAIGAFLGLQASMAAMIAGALGGTVIGFAFIKLTGRDPRTYPLPFGSFLGTSALIIAFAVPGT